MMATLLPPLPVRACLAAFALLGAGCGGDRSSRAAAPAQDASARATCLHSVTPAVATQAAWDAYYGRYYRDAAIPALALRDPPWHGHYFVRAYVTMAKTFGDTKYLDRAVATI